MKTNTPKMKKLFGKKNQKLGLKRVKEDVGGRPEGEDDDELSTLDNEASDFDAAPEEGEDQDFDLSDETDPSEDDLGGDEDDMVASDNVDGLGDDGDVGGMDDEDVDGGKDLLKQMIMAIIDGDEEAASDALHQYMTSTTKDMIDDSGDEGDVDLGGEGDVDDLGGEGDDLGGEGDDLGGEGDDETFDFGGDAGGDEDELNGRIKEGKTWKDSKKNKVDPKMAKGKVCKKCKKAPCKC